MLIINGTPVDVGLLNVAAYGTESRRLGRVPRLREVDCDRLDAIPVTTVCRPEGNPMHDQRVFRGSNFVRPRPDPRASTQRKPSATLRRKLREARARLLLRAGGSGDYGGHRADAQVQCVGMAEPGRRGTLATQTSAATAAQTYLSGAWPHLQSFGAKCETGLDKGTHLTAADLTDPGAEASRLAEPTVAGALERAAVAVLYEDDAAASRAERAAYEARRLADRVRQLALEYRETCRRRAGLQAQSEAKRAAPGPTFRAIHGRSLARVYAAAACADAAEQIAAAGYWTDEAALDGWLHDRIRVRGHDRGRARDLLAELIGDTIANRHARFADRGRSDRP